jgi:hypothetical protein
MKALILNSTKAVKKVIPPRMNIPEFILVFKAYILIGRVQKHQDLLPESRQ